MSKEQMTKMPTPESILENYEPNREYDSYYHENNVIEAMHTYASLMLDELAERIILNEFKNGHSSPDVLRITSQLKSELK